MSTGLSEAQMRVFNLIEILAEEAEDQGQEIPRPPDDAVTSWSEADVRSYYASGGGGLNFHRPLPHLPSQTSASSTPFPPADDSTFKKWFPGLAFSRTACSSTTQPKLRVLCFANAGSAEDMYTSEGTGSRRTPSPLLEWCRSNQVECLAPQYPGRGMRLHEQRITKASDMARTLLPVIASKLYDVPWIVIAHSVGTWIAYEFLMACKAAGIPQPKAVFLSAMPGPDIPLDERPWRQQRTLNEEEFKEECRGWDISDIVFSPAMWLTYHQLLRDDFTLFDEYNHQPDANFAIQCPVLAFWGTLDRRVKQKHVELWKERVTGSFRCEAVTGNHLWPQDKISKTDWLSRIVAEIEVLEILSSSRSR